MLNVARTAGENVIIFTTYHSLHRIQEADVEVNTSILMRHTTLFSVTFSLQQNTSAADSDRCYFFTATPKHSLSVFKPGMNDTAVYGNVICNVPAPQLVEEGYILPPKVVVQQLPQGDFKQSDDKNFCWTPSMQTP